MSTYSAEFKAQIVKKMMPPNNQSVAHILVAKAVFMPPPYTVGKNSFKQKDL